MAALTAARRSGQRTELFTDLGVPAGQPNMFNDHIVSGLQIGIDHKLYISVGDKGVPKATGPDGRTAQVFGGGVLRCNLDATGLEVFSSGTRNHLEPNLDARDNLFTYDNTDDGLGWWTRVTHHVDGGYYGYPWDYHDHKDRMLDRMAEYGGGSPCGGFVYKEDVWPENYRGRAFWAEWAKRVVRGIDFAPAGATFKVASDSNFIEPGEVGDFRPLDLALSHDGRTMYVADWGMGGWGNKTEKLGRVYAVTYTGKADLRARGNDSDPVEGQIRQLDHPSFNERFRAQTALIKKGKAALGAVTAALADPKTDPVAKRHLVWVVDAVAGGKPEGISTLVEATKSPAADVRAQAVRALGERATVSAALPLLGLLRDPEPSVRLQVTVALGRMREAEAVPDLLPVLADPDTLIAFSARKALKRIGDWKAAAAGLGSPDPKVRAGVMLAMEGEYELDAVEALARFVSDPQREPSERARALAVLGQGHRMPIPWDGRWWGTQPAKTNPPAKSVDWAGTPRVLAAVRERLADPSAAVRLAAVTAETEDGETAALPVLRERLGGGGENDPTVRRAILQSFGTLRDRASLGLLSALLGNPATGADDRSEAVASLVAIGDDDALRVLLKVLGGKTLLPAELTRLVAALGRFKSPEAVGALLGSLKNETPAVRAAAAEALGKVGKADAAVPIRGLLADKDLAVRKAAVAALGKLKDRASVPALLAAADAAETRYEATLALAAVPDARALGVYLRGLTDRSPEIRRAASDAVTVIRDDAAPVLEKLAARKELPSTALPELRKIFTKVRPLPNWRVVGPFPIKTELPFPAGGPVDLKATFPGFKDEPLAWRRARPVDGRGQVDLGRLLKTSDDDLAAFGYAEIESPAERKAEFSVGSDDTLTVWVNGEKAYDFQDRRSFSPEESRFDAPLVKGTNRVVVKCGNRGGGWQFAVAVAYPSSDAFLQGPAPGAFDAEAYRKFALSAGGKAEHGRALFSDLKGLACVKCHAVGGQGGAVGPELTSVGAKYPKDEIITAVLYPSAKISSGYEPVTIATADGKVVTGIVKGETPDAVEVEDAEGKRLKVAKGDIDERKQGDVSIMPNGLAEGLSRQDFADLIAYLETLKDKEVGAPKPAAGGGR